MSDLICEHCGCPGATMGYYGDAHDDLIECIEALKARLREQDQRMQRIEDRLTLLEGRGVERAA